MGELGPAAVRKNAQPAPLGWSAASRVLVIFAVCPRKELGCLLSFVYELEC